MADKTSTNREISEQQSTPAKTTQLGIGRGKPVPEMNNPERQNTDDNRSGGHNRNSGGGFGCRSGGTVDNRGGRGGHGRFESGNEASSEKACYQCNKMGHIRRDCPELRKETRGGFHQAGGNRNVKLTSPVYDGTSSMRITVRNPKNRKEDDQTGNNKTKDFSAHTAVPNSTRQAGGFRGNIGNRGGGRRGFNAGNRGNRGRGNRINFQSLEHLKGQKPSTTEDDYYYQEDIQSSTTEKHQETSKPSNQVNPIESFEDANLDEQVLSNIHRAQFKKPTPLQCYTIPNIRRKNDILVSTQIGSGKIASFLLPIISNLLEYYSTELSEKHQSPSPLCLIISPTHELASQIEFEARIFSYETPVITCSASNDTDINTTSNRLQKGCHILSATTDCLKDMVEKRQILLQKVKYLVLLEVDRMFNQDFVHYIHKLEELGLPPKDKRLTSIFSNEFQKVFEQFLRDNYIPISIDSNNEIYQRTDSHNEIYQRTDSNNENYQTIEEVRQADKKARLLQLFQENLNFKRCLIYAETKQLVDYIGAELTKKKLMNIVIHEKFIEDKCSIFITTFLAPCNAELPSIDCVIFYDLPESIEFYFYWINNSDKLISFFDPDRSSDLKVAFDLVSKCNEIGLESPEFLKKYVNISDETVEDEWEDEED